MMKVMRYRQLHSKLSSVSKETFCVPFKDKLIPAVVDLPRSETESVKGKICIIFTHGAGGDMNLPQLSILSTHLSSGDFIVVRFTCKALNVKYRTLVFGKVADFVASKYEPKGLFIGGRSMGSRAAAMLAGEMQEGLTFCSPETFRMIFGVICISYPLHRPHHTSELREQPLLSCSKPILFVSGSNDAMCKADLLFDTCKRLKCNFFIHWLPGFEHGLQIKNAYQNEIFEEACASIETWCHKILVS